MNAEEYGITRIAVIGLGYVGLPVAVAFSKYFPTVGFDISERRIRGLNAGQDASGEVNPEDLQSSNLAFSHCREAMKDANVYVVTVPTPVDEANRPELSALVEATKNVASVLKRGDLVVYESTVFPGATEEVCTPILGELSGLILNEDFMVGYSPERINPGDSTHGLGSVVKVVSASSEQALKRVDELYRTIATAGTFRAASIRVAEMAKVIENTQRDLNIALMNEVAVICNKLSIDTGDVLDVARTKWNFLEFTPGLVGGHCVGVDPYYLTYKATALGHHPEVILAGRRINNSIPQFVASRVKTLMIESGVSPLNSRVLVLGLAFKENCADIRNSKAIDLIEALQSEGAKVDAYDPIVSEADSAIPDHVTLIETVPQSTYDAIVLAVAHRNFFKLGTDQIREFGTENCIVFDVKHILPRNMVTARL